MYSLILHGRRSIELQKWRNFSVSVKLLENVFSAFSNSSFSNSYSSAIAFDVSSRDGRKGENFTVSYLIDSLGLTTKLAESISRKVSFEDKVNPDSVLSLLRIHGFTDPQISSIVTIYPNLLIADAEKSLAPKLQFLQSRGASSSEITEIVSKVPKILGKKEVESISLYYDFVKDILQDEEEEEEEEDSMSLPQSNMIRNVSALRELGMPQRLLFSLLNSGSDRFHHINGKEKFKESLKKVVEMGFDPTTSYFVGALHVVYRLSGKTIEGKVNVCKRLGFSVGDVWAMFKKHPSFMSLSEKKILQTYENLKKCGLLEDEVLSVFKKYPQCIGVSEQKILNTVETFLGLGFSSEEFATMIKRYPPCLKFSAESVKNKAGFLVKEMNWPLKALVSNPEVFGLSMENRTIPRCYVIKALMSKGLLGDTGSELPLISSVLRSTDKVFLNRFVMKHGDKELVSRLMAIFTGKNRKTNKASE